MPEDISRYGVASRDLMRFLTAIPARKIFLILDSCRSGAVVEALEGRAFDDAVGRKALRRIARVGGIHILAASRADEDAAELNAEPHGSLTFLLLQGIRGKADDNRDQKVTVREIVRYATREMPLLSQQLVTETISQMPVGHSRGAILRSPGVRNGSRWAFPGSNWLVLGMTRYCDLSEPPPSAGAGASRSKD